ncbi:hypothetical protein HU830_01825 [Lactobacillus sp. DCY120]|uniref:IrrE N-terminal-like domain-containing protein n=1 Tax=Bombilactobacillus apium TaxID=2675299 RepID=A0A850R1N2_9LACO|nr:hypothetical protein [Bombilactobacillus apium]NVY95931.1 hypothetical protein [Bombilactobacillus apium]
MDDLITYLLNYAFQNGYGYEILNDAHTNWPSLAYPKMNLIFINLNWHQKREIPFQIAHEIGHLIDGDACHRSRLHQAKINIENQADLHAIRILRQYCFDYDFRMENPLIFAEQFGIPSRLYDVVTNKWSG